MAECSACGARYSPDEHFCGNCGIQLIPNDPELKTIATTLDDEVDAPPMTSAQLATTLEDADTRETPVAEKEPPAVEEPPPVEAAEVEEAPAVEEPTAVEEEEQPAFEDHASAKSDSFHESAVAHAEAVDIPKPISSESLGGSYTDSIHPAQPSHTSQHRGTT
ncbi:MAG TPA: zinc ribbon domain-containing protein, partial [Pyrinomonadaceae bacterium]|nr:zinc ribbon domain-containing protein [Pyrinomonadaceae bacterium]